MPANSSILLIEDSPGECELFRLALVQVDLDALLYTEHDADTAWLFLTNRAGHEPLPSLVILDLQLRGQHGRDFLRRLRADTRFAHIPVVVFTTSDNPADVATCYTSGANGYVVKPGTFDELVHCTADLCRYWLHWNRSPHIVETRC